MQKMITVTYEDVGALRNEVSKIREMVELPLGHPELFKRLGIQAPKGVILHGPPGTGKTLLAKAIANETTANFYSLSGPEIMSKFYGESEERLRNMFQQAEQNSPAILSEVTHGFVGANIQSLAKEAVSAIRRVLPEIDLTQESIPGETLNKISVTMQDFTDVLRDIEASAMREVFVEIPNVTWNDVGGLYTVKEELLEAVKWPLKFKRLFGRRPG
jgi:SpoVK/Ycf46/Vps4 family AAA+-type ATPase